MSTYIKDLRKEYDRFFEIVEKLRGLMEPVEIMMMDEIADEVKFTFSDLTIVELESVFDMYLMLHIMVEHIEVEEFKDIYEKRKQIILNYRAHKSRRKS